MDDKYIDKKRMKELLVKYVEEDCKESENELFSEVFIEIIHVVIFSLSISSHFTIFEELEQNALIKLHKEIIENKRLDLTRTPTENFNYLWTIVQRSVLADLKKYYKYSSHIKLCDSNFYIYGEGRFDKNENDWDLLSNI